MKVLYVFLSFFLSLFSWKGSEGEDILGVPTAMNIPNPTNLGLHKKDILLRKPADSGCVFEDAEHWAIHRRCQLQCPLERLRQRQLLEKCNWIFGPLDMNI